MLYHLAASLPMMVCLIWAVILWIEFPASDPARRLLAVFALVATVLYACHFVHFEGDGAFGLVDCIWCLCTLSVYPLYRLYVVSLTTRNLPPLLTVLPWFVPALSLFAWSLAVLVRGDDPETLRRVIGIVDFLVSVTAAVSCFVQLFRFRRSVRNYYADTEGKLLNPILVLLVLLAVIALASAVSSLLGRARFEGSSLLLIPSLLFSTLLFGIFYTGWRTVRPEPEVREEVAEPVMDDARMQQLMQRIEREMIIGERFRMPGLKISDVAEAVGSNRSYVSGAINRLSGLSFSDYVNRFRVRYAQELIRNQGKALPLSEVSERSGYADRTSFYRAFKKETGVSPSEWMTSFYDMQP